MTKKVRIENADNAPYRVLVQTWDKAYPEGSGPDTLVREEILGCPCAMTGDATYITSTRYLVIREA